MLHNWERIFFPASAAHYRAEERMKENKRILSSSSGEIDKMNNGFLMQILKLLQRKYKAVIESLASMTYLAKINQVLVRSYSQLCSPKIVNSTSRLYYLSSNMDNLMTSTHLYSIFYLEGYMTSKRLQLPQNLNNLMSLLFTKTPKKI